jgi:hypothetical protein
VLNSFAVSYYRTRNESAVNIFVINSAQSSFIVNSETHILFIEEDLNKHFDTLFRKMGHLFFAEMIGTRAYKAPGSSVRIKLLTSIIRVANAAKLLPDESISFSLLYIESNEPFCEESKGLEKYRCSNYYCYYYLEQLDNPAEGTAEQHW